MLNDLVNRLVSTAPLALGLFPISSGCLRATVVPIVSPRLLAVMQVRAFLNPTRQLLNGNVDSKWSRVECDKHDVLITMCSLADRECRWAT